MIERLSNAKMQSNKQNKAIVTSMTERTASNPTVPNLTNPKNTAFAQMMVNRPGLNNHAPCFVACHDKNNNDNSVTSRCKGLDER